jgi:FkbM family methyltransferase
MALKMWQPYVWQTFKPQNGDVVVDIGAHIGYYTIHAAKSVGPDGLVVSVEPDPRNFELLKKNVEYHNLQNVKLMNCALSSYEGSALFGLSNNPLFSQLISKDASSEHSRYSVDVTTLDNLCRDLNINQINWLKIDVENGALDVLKGGSRILRTQANAIIEVPDSATLSMLKDLGFSLHPLTPSESEIGYYYASRNQDAG